MGTLYTVILCLSAAMTSWTAVRITRRLESMSGLERPLPTGLFVAISSIGFLIIVAAPAMTVVGAVLLFTAAWRGMFRPLPSIAWLGVPVIAVLLGMASVPLAEFKVLPAPLTALAIGLGWLGITLSADAAPDAARPASWMWLLATGPLIAAGAIGPGPSHLVLDSLMLAASLFAGAYAAPNGHLSALCRRPYAFVFGWLVAESLLRGAPLFAAAALILWGAGFAARFIHPTTDSHAEAL